MNSFKRSLFPKTKTCLKEKNISKILQMEKEGKQISNFILNILNVFNQFQNKKQCETATEMAEELFFLIELLKNKLNSDLTDI